MRYFFRAAQLAAIAACFAFVGPVGVRQALAQAGNRVALVIGNGSYKSAPSLPNPVTDAKAVAASFRRLGFNVTDGYDLTVAEMRAKIASFFATLPDAQAAVIYYAGHGVAVDGENYLVPTDLALKSPADLDLQAIDVSLLLKQLKREERANIIILDACRDNPFAEDLSKARTRALVGSRGLSAIDNDLAKGAMIAYASDPNSTALDGRPGENSPFTKALLHHLEDTGVPVDTVMSRVRTEVWNDTDHKQMPWVNTSLVGELTLNPQQPGQGSSVLAVTPAPLGPMPAPPEPNRSALEARLWDSAERGNTQTDYQAYLDAYPSGIYAQMARGRVARLTPPDAKASPVIVDSIVSPPQPLKSEIGTEQTEAALNFDLAKRKEVQARLAALAFDVGGVTGQLGEKTRTAIVGWQKSHGVQPTGWLGPLQYAALKQETDSSYQSFLNAAPSEEPARRRSHFAQSRSMYSAPRHYHRYSTHYGQGDQRQRYGTPTGGGMDAASAAAFGGFLGGVIGHFH